MSEMTPDPAIEKLMRFTPAALADSQSLLFAAGRASARTPRGWKLAVALLLAANFGWLAAWSRLSPQPAAGEPPPTSIAPTEPTPAPAPAPAEPWSYRSLISAGDPDLPRSEPSRGLLGDGPELTPRSIRDVD